MERWLAPESRYPNPYKTFAIIDYKNNPPSEEVKKYLIDLLRENRIDPKFLEAAKKRLSWAKLKLLEKAKVPSQLSVKRGDFGEAVSSAALAKLHGYRIPVPKLHFTVTGNQTLPSTDVLAIKEDNSRVTEVCFVESKLRTVVSKQTAVQGCRQLEHDQSMAIPHMVLFAANRLFEVNDALADKLLDYLDSREEKDVDTSSLNLFFEDSIWTEEVMENLEAIQTRLPHLTVRVTRIVGLGALTDELFARLGVNHVIDEEDE
jgi:Cap4 SAVED domain